MSEKILATYQDLCTQVYDLSKPIPPHDAYQFYLSYLKEAIGPILEPMCGSGRFLLPYLEAGFDIHGFDASAHMLKALESKGQARGLKPKIWQGFISELKSKELYDLIFIPSGSFGLITDPKAATQALQLIHQHLSDKGVFVFETETFASLPLLGIWRGSVWQKASNQKILLSQLASLRNQICTSIAKYELIETNQIVKTEVEEYKVRLYDQPHEVVGMLSKAGFREIQMLKAFDRSAEPAEGNAVIVYECRK